MGVYSDTTQLDVELSNLSCVAMKADATQLDVKLS